MPEESLHSPIYSLRLYLLGQFRVECGGREIPDDSWQRRKTRGLVKALAVEPLHRLHREQLQEAFWPELDPSAGDRSLRKALHHARHLLQPDLGRGEGSIYLRWAGDMLVLDTAHVWVDADHFERLAQQALSSGSRTALETAASLYGGDLLPEDLYEEWTIERRATLIELWVQVLLRLSDVYERSGRIVEASDRLQQALSRDPAREEIHRRIMRLYAAGGSRHQALRQYQILRQALADAYDAEPDEETEALYAEIREGRSTHAPATSRPSGSQVLPPILRELPHTPMVGRERSFEMLETGLFSHVTGKNEMFPALILVSGEAGVGKTRLMLELARTALERDIRVLWGTSYETEGTLPYGPFIDALNNAVTAFPEERRKGIAEAQPELARILPILGAVPSPESLDQGNEQPRLFASVTRLLEQLADERPLLLVLDDVHAMDTVSLQLLHHLTRLASGQQWLIAGTYRDESVLPGSDLHTMLTALHRSGLVRHMDLLRLARADCDRLVCSLLGDAEVDADALKRIYELSMGNPLFAGELVQTMRDAGELECDTHQWALRGDGRASQTESVPEQIRELVEARVHSLGDRAQQALALAATAGMQVSFGVLAAAAASAFPDSLSENALLDALDAALVARVLEERGDAYAFRHPLFREALYSRLSTNRRSRLHLSLAQAIESEQPDDVERLAHHYVLGGDRKKAVIHLRQAGERSEDIHAYAVAETYYRALLDMVSGCSIPEEAYAREHLGTVIFSAGRAGEALTYLEPASLLYDALVDVEGLARVELCIAQARHTLGFRAEALARLRAVITDVERRKGTPQTRARLLFELGSLLFYNGQYDESVLLAEQGAQLALEANDLRTYAWAQSRLGLGLQMIGRVAESQATLERCIPMLDPVRDSRYLALALNNLGVVHEFYGNTVEAVEHGRRALHVAERSGEPWLMAAMGALLGGSLLELGEWNEARSCLDRSGVILDTLDLPATGLMRLCYVARLEYVEGDWAAAIGHLQQIEDESSQLGDIQCQRMGQAAFAEIAAREGRPHEVVRRLEPLLDRPGMEEPVVAVLLSLLARAHQDLNNSNLAEEMSLRALSRCESRGYIGLLAPCLLHIGVMCARQGRWKDADDAFGRAVSIAEALPNPYLVGRCLAEWSEAHDRQGNSGVAAEKLAFAHAIFVQIGAQKDAALTQDDITLTGSRRATGLS